MRIFITAFITIFSLIESEEIPRHLVSVAPSGCQEEEGDEVVAVEQDEAGDVVPAEAAEEEDGVVGRGKTQRGVEIQMSGL